MELAHQIDRGILDRLESYSLQLKMFVALHFSLSRDMKAVRNASKFKQPPLETC